MIAEERAVLALTEELHAKGATLGDAYNCAVMGVMGAIFAQAVGRDHDIELSGDYSQISPEELGAIYEETIGFKPCLDAGKIKLQPGGERRRSGSHYTPRELTRPIVETTFRPILEALGERPTAEQILELKVCDPAMGSGAFLVEATRQLGDQLVKAWELHDSMPAMPADEDPILHARRLVAQRCIYGVDKNPFAVNLAKLSIWLLTLAKDHTFTFIDHALKHGDALVGLTRAQICAFHWKESQDEDLPILQLIAKNLGKARAARDDIAALGDEAEATKRLYHREAEEALEEARLMGDLCIAAFFGAGKDKDREALRIQYQAKMETWRQTDKGAPELRGIVEELRGGEKPVPPLHWEIEFPEVFGRENPGFDAMVGNPPFLGGSRISSTNSPSYLAWLLNVHPHAHGNGDLVAHFFSRAFNGIRSQGIFGLIATNSICQGDTRTTGLEWIRNQGGQIFSATKRYRWPGLAAVVVSVIHIAKDATKLVSLLDGRRVNEITSFLFHGGTDDFPPVLHATKVQTLSYSGSKVTGAGFVLSPQQAEAWIADEPKNQQVILPYIDGANVNRVPDHAAERHIICFEEWPREKAGQWPGLFSHLGETVRVQRASNRRAHTRDNWWQYEHYRRALYERKAGRSVVMVNAGVSQHLNFVFVGAEQVFSHALNVYLLDTHAAFCALQSRPHELWARFFGSSLEDRLRYTPSDCFETFPFPENWQTDPTLEAAGKTYYEYRADLMVRNDEGLTKTYNRFHDPNNHEPDIVKLRELHAAMDRAVLDAYGWDDISTDCEFLLDYEIDEETWGTKKKPYRYRWPEAVHDEVLARLLDLNQKRYEEEVAQGLHEKRTRRVKY